jgi:hypothetical protein
MDYACYWKEKIVVALMLGIGAFWARRPNGLPLDEAGKG